MRLLTAASVTVLAFVTVPADCQTVTGLLARGRTIAFPDATAPSIAPLAVAEFRLPLDSVSSRAVAWSVGALGDELQRIGTRASVRAPAGRFAVHATFERAAVRKLEEISNFERTGESIAAHDGRLEVGVLTPLTLGLWGGATARYAESVLADRQFGAGEFLVNAGWRHARGFESAFEAGVVTFARASAPESEQNPYGRLAAMSPVLFRNVRIAAGATWNELGIHRDRPLNIGGAVRWDGWRERLRLSLGGEWGPTGLTDTALEAALRAGSVRLGTRIARQSPGLNAVQLWFGSAR